MTLVEFVPPVKHPLWKLCLQMGITDVIVKVNPTLTGLPDPWKLSTLTKIVDGLKAEGLRVVGLEGDPFDMTPVKQFGEADITPEMREQTLAHYRELLESMAALGIRLLCYNFMVGPGWSRSGVRTTRGGAQATYFSEKEYAVAYAKTLPGGASPQALRLTKEQVWANYEHFIRSVMPTAERVGVRMGLHPDDPCLPSLGGFARILETVADYDRAYAVYPSPSNAVTYCQANFKLMGADLVETAKHFGKRIAFIHVRDVEGDKHDFTELFHDQGTTDQFELMRTYRALGLDVPVRGDHVPEMEGDRKVVAEAIPGYFTLGRLFANGFLKALLKGTACTFALFAAFATRAEERYDVVVVGGTTRGIEAAKAAKAAGKSVYLVTPHPYLGEDRAGTLELGWGDGVRPQTALEDRLWKTSTDRAAFEYVFDHPTDGIRGIFTTDTWRRLSNDVPPHIMSDGVLYLGDVTYTCTLTTPGEIATVSALAFETPAYLVDNILRKDVLARLEKEKPGVRRVATAGVWMRPLDGPRAGEKIVLRRVGKVMDVPGDFAHATGAGVRFEASVSTTFTRAEICFQADPTAHHQMVARMAFHLARTATIEEMPSPLRVKQVFDRELLDAEIPFLTSSPVRRVLRRTDGTPDGVEIINRSGRRTIRAGEVVDATLYGTLGKVPVVGATETFSRIVISDRVAPAADGLKVEAFGNRLTAPHNDFDGRAYRCTFALPMKDGSFPSFAAAEWDARELTRTPALADAADFLVWHPSAKALAEAKPMTDELPVWGDYDVVVVGGGTAGAAAAIGAARNGARTLVVEYLESLGGIGTDGMIGGFYDGNMVGFAPELKARTAEETGYCQYKRAEAWRKLCRETGVTVWFGAMGLGALREGDRVVGVEVATALGCGLVRAKSVVDGTGNSDVAAAAGAQTELFGAGEFGVQSAGQTPQRLGFGGANSDFGYLNDADANDLWLFMVRARAGAPVGWDIAKMPASRERRRIVPDLRVTGEDAVGRRRYPDVIVQARSRQDPHGYLTDSFAYLAEASTELVPGPREPREMFNINIPLRATLPRGLSGIAVCGLGAGLERDVLAITRMQGDLVNMGFSVGTAAALAARKGGEFRAIDLKELRTNLARAGILRAETLAWEKDDDVSSDALIAASVKTLPDGYRGGHVIYRPENRARALPLLRAALAEAKDEKAMQAYALAMGLLGDASGLDILLGILSGDRVTVDVRAGHRGVSYGRGAVVDFGGGSVRSGALLALGRTHDPRAIRPLLSVLDEVTAESELGQVRPITLALEALADPRAASALAAKLRLPGIGGHAVSDFRTLPPLGGYGIGPEFDRCLREIALARALMACGDSDGLARRTFEAYARDPRGALAAHAKAVLRAHP